MQMRSTLSLALLLCLLLAALQSSVQASAGIGVFTYDPDILDEQWQHMVYTEWDQSGTGELTMGAWVKGPEFEIGATLPGEDGEEQWRYLGEAPLFQLAIQGMELPVEWESDYDVAWRMRYNAAVA